MTREIFRMLGFNRYQAMFSENLMLKYALLRFNSLNDHMSFFYTKDNWISHMTPGMFGDMYIKALGDICFTVDDIENFRKSYIKISDNSFMFYKYFKNNAVGSLHKQLIDSDSILNYLSVSDYLKVFKLEPGEAYLNTHANAVFFNQGGTIYQRNMENFSLSDSKLSRGFKDYGSYKMLKNILIQNNEIMPVQANNLNKSGNVNDTDLEVKGEDNFSNTLVDEMGPLDLFSVVSLNNHLKLYSYFMHIGFDRNKIYTKNYNKLIRKDSSIPRYRFCY